MSTSQRCDARISGSVTGRVGPAGQATATLPSMRAGG
jgi:hypothetical protein